MTIHCIVCDVKLANLDPQIVHPCHGLAFETKGHYGSTIFDPHDGTILEVAVCDTCLGAAAKKGRVWITPPVRPAKRPSPTKWRPAEA